MRPAGRPVAGHRPVGLSTTYRLDGHDRAKGSHEAATHFLEESTVDGLGRTTDTEYDGQVDASALVRVFAARANGPRPHWSVLGADTVPATRS